MPSEHLGPFIEGLMLAEAFPCHWQRSKRLNAYLWFITVVSDHPRWAFFWLLWDECLFASPEYKRYKRKLLRDLRTARHLMASQGTVE